MIIGKDMELVEGLPVLYIASIKALVVSDLHLGYEGGMAKTGVVIPKANLKSILESITKAVGGRDVKQLIIVGDIKNNFSKVSIEELRELREITTAMREKGVAVEMVKGNHDNFIETYSKDLGIRVHNDHLILGDYLFAHGDKQLSPTDTKISTIIIGHEHPSIGIRTRFGTMERMRCFLYGDISYSGRKANLIVLPAIGYFETGSDVNVYSKSRIMSPVLKKAGIDSMEAIVVSHGSTLSFGRVGSLRRLEL
jgi:putative SbcD/Mre11-related phosphoesterase